MLPDVLLGEHIGCNGLRRGGSQIPVSFSKLGTMTVDDFNGFWVINAVLIGRCSDQLAYSAMSILPLVASLSKQPSYTHRASCAGRCLCTESRLSIIARNTRVS